MGSPDRLTALDSSFLHLEHGPAHMHVGSVLVFEGEPPEYGELLAHLESRLHLVPRYRQRLAFVPFGQGRPVWVDDPSFNVEYHVRHCALPAPGDDGELKRLAGRLFSQGLDRAKPLWELYLVEGLAPDGDDGERFAIVAKTHHCLVDGVSGVDITTVLFDTTPDTPPAPPAPEPWHPRPEPSSAELLAQALLERGTVPQEIARGVRRVFRAPRRIAERALEDLQAVGTLLYPGLGDPAPLSPLNLRIGPHRRFTWHAADLERVKRIKNGLGGTVNDAVLASVALGLGRWMRRHGHATEGLQLKAMVPVSVRADVEQGALGNRVAAMWAPLPVGVVDPTACFRVIHDAMDGLKQSGQAVGAEVLTQLADFAPPTVMAQAARLQARQRFFNLTVTNVPGPQFPLYVLGRRLHAMHPQVPLTENTALGIAIMSYDGTLHFGLLSDFDAIPDIEELSEDLAASIAELESAAGGGPPLPGGSRPPRPRRRPAVRDKASARSSR